MIYVWRSNKHGENEELKCSLILARKNLLNDGDKAIIIGLCPENLREIFDQFISVPTVKPSESPRPMRQTILNQYIVLAREFPNTDIVLLDDDLYCLKPCDYIKSPQNYSSGLLKNKMEWWQSRYGKDRYYETLADTIKYLGDGALSYDDHFPFNFNTTAMLSVVEEIIASGTFVMERSIYGNRYCEPIFKPDAKIREVDEAQSCDISDYDWISSQDNVIGDNKFWSAIRKLCE